MALIQSSSQTSAAPPQFLPNGGGPHRLRAQLQSLPIARDSLGRSFTFNLPSPKSTHPASPAALLLESLRTPEFRKSASPLGRVQSGNSRPDSTDWLPQDGTETVLHLEKCLEASPAGAKVEPLSVVPQLGSAGSPFGVACNGSPSARAVSNLYPDSYTIPCQQFEGLFFAVQSREADRALLPVESTLDGTTHRAYDLLLRHNLHIVGEIQWPAVQERVRFPSVEVFPGNGRDLDVVNRYWVLAREPVMPKDEDCFKTTVALVLADGLGDLYKVLAVFALRGIKVTKLESRPWRNKPLRTVERSEGGVANYFEYVVFIDFEASLAKHCAQNALAQLQQHSSFLRVLGSYPTMDRSMTTQRNCAPARRNAALPH